jgi:hypothetical protein
MIRLPIRRPIVVVGDERPSLPDEHALWFTLRRYRLGDGYCERVECEGVVVEERTQ